ncbi:hypothetical protein QQS21_002205 [Conoideocrella luteorostrata]|uniref:25S rRNA (Uridine(2843)-N(3))-methyltransferase n=1 Tax=Conoideocrella luteorostrata TaxID=1105319 RepID=A0AAJ0CVP1_9HYPO|nr:hypothetical protein QQS21_002205 [Conoideocrella luteorostrata]
MVSKTPAPKKKVSHKPTSTRHQSPPSASPDGPNATQSQKDQQVLLNIFSDAFASLLSSNRFPTLLQEIKQALFNREFGAAFANEEYLEVYAARWSPTRALCYAAVVLGIQDYTNQTLLLPEGDGAEPPPAGEGAAQAEEPAADVDADEGLGSKPNQRLKMLCLGGCAAEHVAFASYLQHTNSKGSLSLVDSGPWTLVCSVLQNQLTTPPPLSKYASIAAKAANRRLVAEDQLSYSFIQADVLGLAEARLAEIVGSQPLLVTLMFTLNELYTDGGIGKTTKLLRNLGKVLPSGSLLLVVDSPGSYSEAAVGKEKKKYPMQWLLSHTLLESKVPEYTWEQLESRDSIWFRLPDGLSYPIQLENMRYQMHLYRIHQNKTL